MRFYLIFVAGLTMAAIAASNPLKIIVSHGHTSGSYIRECVGDCVFRPTDKLHFFIEDTQIFPEMLLKQQGTPGGQKIEARKESGRHFLGLRYRHKMNQEEKKSRRKFKLMEMDFTAARLEPGEYYLTFPSLEENGCITGFKIECEELKHRFRKTETICEFIRDPILMPI